jgi:hypothetical protein
MIVLYFVERGDISLALRRGIDGTEIRKVYWMIKSMP